jgi:hypothetical protein
MCEIRADEVHRFEEERTAAFKDFSHSDIINMDESIWVILCQPLKTVTEKGVESVKIEVNGDSKAGFTLIEVITASGETLPLFLIAKGLTQKCHKQFGRCFSGTIDHLKSGWANQGVFLRFL